MDRVREVKPRTMSTPAAQAPHIHLNHEVMTVRKLLLLLGVGALWLFVAALPAFADGGPHIMTTNNGTTGLTADTCAGCHRAHTATAAGLLNNEQPDLCLDCHNGTKATTDVVDGVQYENQGGGAVAGALRGGGFTYALIDSAHPARLSYDSSGNVRNIGHVQPLDVTSTGQAVTSTHEGSGTVWGNGATGVGATVDLECASCHNPHGNGQYRILQTSPSLTATAGAFTVTNSGGVQVQDTALAVGSTRNYTIRPSTNGYLSGLVDGTSGDYWRYHWDPTGALAWTLTSGGPSADPMNTGWTSATQPYENATGVHYSFRYPVNTGEIAQYQTDLTAAGLTTDPISGAAIADIALNNKGGLMTAWCVQCHTRYDGVSTVTGTAPTQSLSASSLVANSDDATFHFKHGTTRVGCEQCHVSHGSNAAMTGGYSSTYADPSEATSNDSRLLKVNNRGTCQLCHDPTGTLPAGWYIGPSSASGGLFSGLFTGAPYVPGN